MPVTAVAPSHEADGRYPTYDRLAAQSPGPRVAMHAVECPRCGHEVPTDAVPPASCPKCHGTSWVRTERPGALLAFAIRGGRPCPKGKGNYERKPPSAAVIAARIERREFLRKQNRERKKAEKRRERAREERAKRRGSSRPRTSSRATTPASS